MVAKIEAIVSSMRRNSSNIRFSDLSRGCDYDFDTARHKGTSHRIYKTPLAGDPRVNIQNSKGKAKDYQVKHVLLAIERIEYESTRH